MSCTGCDSAEYCPPRISSLIRDDQRLSLFPIKYQNFWKLYKQQESNFWRAHEIDMTVDKQHFQKLKVEEQQYIEWVLAFFSWGDGLVNENIWENFFKVSLVIFERI